MRFINYTINYFNGNYTPEQVRFKLILLFIFSLPFNIFYSQIVLGLLILTTILDLNKQKFNNIPKQAWIFVSIYLISVIGYFYSTDRGAAGFLLERQLAILLMPVVIPLAVSIDSLKVRSVLNTLSLSCIIAIIYLFIHALYIVHLLGLPIKSILSNEFLNHNFSKPIGIHATYFSIYIALSIFHLIDLYLKRTIPFLKITLVFLILILLSGQVFLASRTIILATFFISLFILPVFLIKRKKKYYGIMVILVVFIITAASNISYIKHRFGDEMANDLFASSKVSGSHAEAEPRIDRWKDAVELIKASPLIGYGTGDEIKMLKIKYLQHRQFVSYFYSFNAHNQYLSYMLKHGILGLLAFIFIISYFVFLSIKSKDVIYLSFMILLIISFFTENILDANKGIFFFAFFNTFFGYNILNRKKKESSIFKET